jgi:hypothetical protein
VAHPYRCARLAPDIRVRRLEASDPLRGRKFECILTANQSSPNDALKIHMKPYICPKKRQSEFHFISKLMAVLNPTFSFFNCPKPRLIEPIHRDGVDPAVLGRNLKRPSRPATGGYCLGDVNAGNCTPWPTITRMTADDLPAYGSPIELQWE